MPLNLVLHQKKVAAETSPVERPILAEAHVESRLRPRYAVFDVLDLTSGSVPVIDQNEGWDQF